ncbi:hypothetical protein Dsin_022979 [Dipteronia sinensis]|uniref:Endonuclease/exonuclease/phosphatase domain-containing protein n=1 Tax=Dipteronia sinensis TaxID=43782 RepID=A0AAE0A2Q4_9ROSI|nr:hypothetical protein Dsin_022979 [Dipteronia sinensis]
MMTRRSKKGVNEAISKTANAKKAELLSLGRKESLNLEKEFMKIQETGLAEGYDFNFKDKKLADILAAEDASSRKWKLKVEVANVIETGVALGFNFHGNENVMMEEIYRMEEEVDQHQRKRRQELWEFILDKKLVLPGLWIIGGDFNTTLDSGERKEGECNMTSVRNFGAFLSRAKVIDILMQGMSFTWSNHRERASCARLDRFLISPGILSWFSNLLQSGLPRNLSDHNAITLGERIVDWGPKPFRFSNDWLEDRMLMKLTTDSWKDCKVSGSESFVLSSKIKAVKSGLKQGNKRLRSEYVSSISIQEKLAAVEKATTCNGWTRALRQ